MDEKFLGLLCGHPDFCHCHGAENRLLFCRIVIHRKVSWRKLWCDDKFVFNRVLKSRDQYNVCCFTFEWRRVVRAVEQGRQSNFKRTAWIWSKALSWLVLWCFCFFFLHCIDGIQNGMKGWMPEIRIWFVFLGGCYWSFRSAADLLRRSWVALQT